MWEKNPSSYRAKQRDNTADAANDASPNSAGAVDVGVTWPYTHLGDDNTAGGTGDNADTPGGGLISIGNNAGDGALTLGGTAVPFTRDDPDTAGTNQATFAQTSRGLGGFAEYHLWTRTADTGSTITLPRTRAIVFTDKEQASAPIGASTVTFSGRVPVSSQLFWNSTDSRYEYDHDGNRATDMIIVGLACPTGVSCDVQRDSRGNITSIAGYRITSNPNAEGEPQAVEVGPVASSEDSTYLAFGIWLTEANDNTAPDPDYTFGAFADGGTAMPAGTATQTVKGDATYNGSAAGLRTTPAGTDFFSASATLNAKFGTDAVLGSVTGKIHNIVAGGTAVGQDIYLGRSVTGGTPDMNILESGRFNGPAWMGAGVTNPETSEVNYPYNGTWDGAFYNPVLDNARTAPNEAEMPPMSAAGTFGVSHTDRMGTLTDTTDDEDSSFVGAFGAHR